jgi:hydrophobic/amphiphilic exporter-1 (mainly G- bacteria), HAE1 family
MGLPHLSVRRPVTIVMVMLFVVIMGGSAFGRLPVELLPNFSFGDISIFVNIRGGMPPVEVESLVTKPIEESIGDVDHLRSIVSISEEGRSRVVLRFEPGIDMDLAALEVREKFSKVKDDLPEEIEKPVVAKFEQSDKAIYILAVTGLDFTTEELRKIAEEELKQRILRVEGVANIEIGGGRERKILVEIDQDRLMSFGLPIGKVINSINLSNLNLLVGDIKKVGSKYLIRAIGEFENLEDVQNVGVAISPSGSIIRIKDLAEVKDSFLEAKSYSRVNTLPVASLYVQKESTANTVSVIEGIERVLEDAKPNLDERIKLVTTFDQSVSIKRAINAVKLALIQGALLAAIVLILFLRDLRSILIIIFSIPISVIATFWLMYFSNITVNIMTLSGLALGTGLILDNSIVVLENIDRLRQKISDRFKAAVQGSQEVLLAIVAGTITTVVVFLPLVFVNKEIRILYSGLALTVAFSLVASLFVAISLVPMLSAHMAQWRWQRIPWIPDPFGRLARFYRKRLADAFRWRAPLLITVLILVGVSIFLYQTKLEKEFIGGTEQEDFTIFVELPTGAKLAVSDEAVKEIEALVEKIPEMKIVSSRVEPWSSKVFVKLVPLDERTRSTKEVIESLRPQVGEVERKYREAFIYFEEAREVEENEVLLEIYGYDYKILYELAVSMVSRMQAVEGLTDVKIRWRKGRPEWLLKVDKQKAARYGLSTKDVAETVHAAMKGLRATLYHTEAKEIEVVARIEEEDRRTLDQLRKLAIGLPTGEQLALDQVVNFEPSIGPSKIWRRNKNRMIQVSANRGRYPFGTAAILIREAISDMSFPRDYHYRFGENYWRLKRNQRELSFALLLVLILVYLVLASLFESYTQPFIIMAAVPLAAIGAIAVLLLAKQAVNIGVLMGFMLLAGLVVNSAIILVDLTNRLRSQGVGLLRAIITSGGQRLRPILMTTSTTILGFLPLALNKTEESALWSPLAITLIGGLLVSTVMTLFIVPSVYLLLEELIVLFRPSSKEGTRFTKFSVKV